MAESFFNHLAVHLKNFSKLYDVSVFSYVDNLAPAAAAAKKRGLCAGIGAGNGTDHSISLNSFEKKSRYL